MKIKKTIYLLGSFALAVTPIVVIMSCSSDALNSDQKKINDIKLDDVFKKINMPKIDSSIFPSIALKKSLISRELNSQTLNGLNELTIIVDAIYSNDVRGTISISITIFKLSLSITIQPKIFDSIVIKGYKEKIKDDIFNSIVPLDVTTALGINPDYNKLSSDIVPYVTLNKKIIINNLDNIYVTITNWKSQQDSGTITLDAKIIYDGKTRIFSNTVISGYQVQLNSLNKNDTSLVTHNNGEIEINSRVTEIMPSTFIDGKIEGTPITSILFAKNSNLKVIGSQSFQIITELNKPLDIPCGIISIEKLAFASLHNAVVNIFSIGSQMSIIGDYAFASMNLEALSIPSSIVSIGNGAFLNSEFREDNTTKYQLAFRGVDPINNLKRKLTLGKGAFNKYLVSNIQSKYWQRWLAYSPQTYAFSSSSSK